jgi:hypothetical protein
MKETFRLALAVAPLPDDHDDIVRAFLARTRRECGLDEQVEDDNVIAQVAAILRGSRDE